ncbi:NusG domain II-containing protein [Acidobacteriota bacterium]
MNRRHFIQSILGTPLLAPLLLASQKATHNSELYLISDQPQMYLYPLLEKLQGSSHPRQKTFAFLNPHPNQDNLKHLLMHKGWSPALHSSYADLTLTSFHLRRETRPSFSLVINGKIWDIRTWKLNSVWQSMTRANSLASLLTVAAFSGKSSPLKNGHAISLFKNGCPIEQLPLKGSWTRRIPTKHGPITVKTQEGHTWITESPCRHKICISTPPVSKPGERIICAPNHFLLEIQGRMVDTVIG